MMCCVEPNFPMEKITLYYSLVSPMPFSLAPPPPYKTPPDIQTRGEGQAPAKKGRAGYRALLSPLLSGGIRQIEDEATYLHQPNFNHSREDKFLFNSQSTAIVVCFHAGEGIPLLLFSSGLVRLGRASLVGTFL